MRRAEKQTVLQSAQAELRDIAAVLHVFAPSLALKLNHAAQEAELLEKGLQADAVYRGER